jgi:hypothetical protein
MTGAARRGVLAVGKVTAAFGAAFYQYDGWARADNARVTTVLNGSTHVLHTPNASWCVDLPPICRAHVPLDLTRSPPISRARCALFNADAPAERQMLTQRPPW